MKTPILGSSYVVRSPNAADARMVNLYPEVIPEGGKEPAYLQRCPGMELIATIGSGPIRGLWNHKNDLYIASGTELYKATPNLAITKLGDITGTGPVSMADNGFQLFVACNPNGFIYNFTTGVFQQITDPDFPGAVTVGYLDGYFVFNEPNSQRVWVTQLLDGLSIDPLDFASAEGSPDGLVAIMIDHREAWLFGTNSVEVWYNSGNPDFPLERIQGAYNEIGCLAPYSVAKLDNSVFWLGSDARGQGIVYRAQGYQGVRVSTHAVEFAIQQYTDMTDAIAYTYQQDGHAFYVLIFPAANTTWVYDAATGSWHERAALFNGEFRRHRSNCHAAFNNDPTVGDFENGNIYQFKLDVYTDANEEQKWLRRWRALPTGQNDLNRTIHHQLQLDCQTGVGLSEGLFDVLSTNNALELWTEQAISPNTVAGPLFAFVGNDVGTEPQVMLRWSDDGGHTWSSEFWRNMGPIGATYTRVIWRRLGATMKSRDRVYEVSGTDPVIVAVMGAELDISPTTA
jgi:hypothetical protein